MKARLKIAVGALVALTLALLSVLGLAVTLERTWAYHPPLFGADSYPRPRLEALKDLEERRREKAEEAARRAELLANLTPEKMVELGREIVHGRGLCLNCHRVGTEGGGTQGPNLAGVGGRAGTRVAGLGDVEYLAQSLYEPGAYLVDGFVAAMTPANEAPIGLDDDEIRMVVAYLQSLGGTSTITPETRLPYGGR